MNQFDFYKEFYFKELDSRNEINNSLSLPIGLISAIVAGIFYLLTTFDYKYHSALTIPFSITILLGLTFLFRAIYNLIKAYSNFPKGYEYFILADTNDLANYERKLKEFYSENKMTDDTERAFEDYVLKELIKNTGKNQKNNKRKDKFRYNCEKHLITSFVMTCLALPFFAVNFGLRKEKNSITDVKLVYPEKIPLEINSKENRNFILEILKDSAKNGKRSINTDSPSKSNN